MGIVSFFVLLTIFIVIPFLLGALFKGEETGYAVSLAHGFMVEWATFFVIAVPAIIFKRSLSELIYPVLGIWLILAVVGGVLFAKSKKSFKWCVLSKSEIIYLGIFLAIVAFQLYKAVFYAYEDGDDSFYVATSQVTNASDRMFLADAYKGNATTMEYRYALAPFPIWIAMVARLSGVNVATLSHVIIPVVFIPLTYIIYNEIGGLLFCGDREKKYMFLSLIALFEMFSNVSTSTSGTFMLTRARQGKEALACIVIPLVFLEVYRIIKSGYDIKFRRWAFLVILCIAGALTSVFANILIPFMILFLVICELINKCPIKRVLADCLVVLPNLCVAFLYIFLD